jgi:hypothetical protein
MISYLVFALTVGNLRIHLTSAFMRIGSVWTVNVTMIVLVLPIVAFLYWSFQPLPTYLEGWTWMEAAREGLARLPEHRGWISEVLAWFYAVEYLKLWLSLQIDSHPLLSGIVYSFDATLTLFIAARANAVSLAAFLAGREGDK